MALALTVAKIRRCVPGSKEVYRIRMLWVNWGFRAGFPTVKLMLSDVVVSGCNWEAVGVPVLPL